MPASRPRILIAQPIEASALRAFEAYADLVIGDNLSEDKLIAHLHSVDAAVLMLSHRLDAAAFEQLTATPLQIIANHAVGIDNLDLAAANQAHIWVSNTPDVLSDATAELALTLMLTLLRRIAEGQELARSGHWQGWEPTQLLGHSLIGKTVGIIGAGRIGKRLAQLLSGFRVKLLYHNRQRDPDFERDSGAVYCELAAICQQADLLSMHVPGGQASQHLIGAAQLALMPAHAVLVNTGRGNSIDQAALTQALSQHKIAGAALDVYEFEPQISSALRQLSNVVLTPHLGSATVQARRDMGLMCLSNIQACLSGKVPPQAVNQPLASAKKSRQWYPETSINL